MSDIVKMRLYAVPHDGEEKSFDDALDKLGELDQDVDESEDDA